MQRVASEGGLLGNVIALESLRTRQIAALRQLINLCQPVSNSLVDEPVWKVLVLDNVARDVVSPLLTVQELRGLGVTLHLQLTASREPLPDVPAVYFVLPTEENVRLIANDLRDAIYSSFYLNFLSAIPRPRIEQLAEAAVDSGVVNSVQKVVDQFLNFISLEDDLFVLRRESDSSPFSFYAINDPSQSEEGMVALVESVADSLFSVCATLTQVPIIRAARGNAAEQVAIRLDQKLRDNLRDARNNVFVADALRTAGSGRPLLVLADRALDLSSMLHHTWTYQALMHDVLDYDLNRVVTVDASSGKKKDFDMSGTTGRDTLWGKHRGSAFPLVAEAVQEQLEEYRGQEDTIRRLKQQMGMDGSNAADDAAVGALLGDATARLSSTVGSLPELLERKRLIDQHMTLATTLLDAIKARRLDQLFELEERLLQGSQLEQPLGTLLADCTHPSDALRVVLLAYLCERSPSKAVSQQLRELITAKGASPAGLAFLERLRSVWSMGASVSDEGAGTKQVSMFGKLLSTSSRFVMEGVKNLVPKKHNLPLTKAVDSLLDGGPGVANNASGGRQTEWLYFDPKLLHTSAGPRDRPPSRAPGSGTAAAVAQDVVVFVVGGGNYVEYQNVVEWGRSRSLQRITYGATELVTPDRFAEQLTRLGERTSAAS